MYPVSFAMDDDITETAAERLQQRGCNKETATERLQQRDCNRETAAKRQRYQP